MELQNIIEDLQNCINVCQSRLNMLKTVQSGQLYEVDMLLTRKEAAYFISKSVRQLDRLCAERKIRREYIDGAVRIRKSDLQKFMGLDIRPISEDENPTSEFNRILDKFN